MWIATQIPPSTQTKNTLSHVHDLCLGISPQVAVLEDGYILISLASLSRYWNLPALRTLPAEPHPLLVLLQKLNRRFGMKFHAAPTAPWALYSFKTCASAQVFTLRARDDFFTPSHSTPLLEGVHLIDDILSAKPRLRPDFARLCETLHALGIRSLEDLRQNAHLGRDTRDAFVQRFGEVCDKLFRRLDGADDRPLEWYEPIPSLTESFHPVLEKQMDSDNESDLIKRFEEIFTDWEERLQARKQVLAGVSVALTSDRRHRHEEFLIQLPRPSRDTQTLMRILKEKWSQRKETVSTHAYDDEINSVEIKSLRIEDDCDRQLNLFDPHREEVAEKWNALVGQLRARESSKQKISIGTYRPFESYLPEKSLDWVEWENINGPLAPVADHPRRPTLLLTPPIPATEAAPDAENLRALRSISSEEDFLNFVEARLGGESLERIRDPWAPLSTERAYARVDRRWLYWDNHQKRVFLHGYFEPELK